MVGNVVTDRLEHMFSELTPQERDVLEPALSELVLAAEFPDTWPDD